MAVLAVLLVLALGALGVSIKLMHDAKTQAPAAAVIQPDANVKVGSLTKSPEEIRAELEREVDESMIAFSINATPYFESGSGEGNLMIENPAYNGNRFTVEIRLKEDDRLVYKSGYLDPGQYIDKVPLDEALPAGEYPAVAYFDAYRRTDNHYIGRAGGELTLYILS